MSLGGLVGAVAGGIVGFFVGGPAGAFIGASIGFSIGTMIDPTTPDVKQPGTPADQFQVTSNRIGDLIPDALGTVKIVGHLLCYGKDRAEATYVRVKTGAKGGRKKKRVLTGYKYYASWGLGICGVGPVDAILTIFSNEKIVWSGEVVRPDSGGHESIAIADMGSMDFYFGTGDQVANARVAEIISDATLNTPYRGLCWAFFDDCFIGNYNRLPTMTFVIKKTPILPFSVKRVIQTNDYNPIHAIWYVLHHLAGLPEAWLHSLDFSAVANDLLSEMRGISILFGQQQAAKDWIELIHNHVDAILRYGCDGKFHPKLIRNDYDVKDLPSVDEKVMLEKPEVTRASWIGTINEVKVQYSEITNRSSIPPPTLAMEYSTLAMQVNGQQTLSVDSDNPGCPPYYWSMQGGGSLSAEEGESVVYTAPSTNPNCGNNPTIILTDSCGQQTSIQIAVNAYTGQESSYGYVGWLECEGCWCSDLGCGQGKWSCFDWIVDRWRCDGISNYHCETKPCGTGSGPCIGQTQGWVKVACGVCNFPQVCPPADCFTAQCRGACGDVSCQCNTAVDCRTQTMKNAGCCPLNPETGLPF